MCFACDLDEQNTVIAYENNFRVVSNALGISQWKNMLVTLIAAMDKNRLIGQQNQLPWHLPTDLAHFKSVTLGKPIIMGRKTFESIGKLLPYRRNIMISRQQDLRIKRCEVFSSLDEALNVLSDQFEVMIIGGGILFKEALPKAHKMILTIIKHSFDGDTYFPLWNVDEWNLVSKINHEPDKNNLYSFEFIELRRKKQQKTIIISETSPHITFEEKSSKKR